MHHPRKLTFDFLTLKVMSESRVTGATSMPISVFLGILCSRLRPDVRDRQTSDAHHRLCPYPRGLGQINSLCRPIGIKARGLAIMHSDQAWHALSVASMLCEALLMTSSVDRRLSYSLPVNRLRNRSIRCHDDQVAS